MLEQGIRLKLKETHREKLTLTLWLAGIAAAWVVVYFINPAAAPGFPRCPFHALTGLYCPGCGSLRALHRLVHGDLYAAFRLNPLMIIFIPYLVYSFISYAKRVITGRSLPEIFTRTYQIWIIFGIIIVYFVLRNIPAYPFTLLAPCDIGSGF
jgi:hypothetical protein